MKKARFPAGWDDDRVRRVIEHYEQQTDEEAIAEDEQWDATFVRSQEVLARAADEAFAENRTGKTRPFDPEKI